MPRRKHFERGTVGGKPDKLMRDALIRALYREAVDANGKPTRRLEMVADKLVDVAMTGDTVAIREIFDRVDGRLPQTLVGEDGGPAKLVIGWVTSPGEAPLLTDGTVIDQEPDVSPQETLAETLDSDQKST